MKQESKTAQPREDIKKLSFVVVFLSLFVIV